jgi:hypothetical protein
LIESARVAGVSADAIAAKHEISRDALYRHMRNHVTEADRASYVADVPIREMAAKAAAQAGGLLDYLVLVRATLFRQFQIASEHGDMQATNNTARAVLEVCRDIARLTGEMQSAASSVTNIQNNHYNLATSPQFAELQSMLVQRLAPFPDALAAVLAGLEALDQKANVGPPLARQSAVFQHPAGLIDLTPEPSLPASTLTDPQPSSPASILTDPTGGDSDG